MYQLKQIIEVLEQLAPINLAEKWDHVGLMIGSRESNVAKVLCALDLTEEVLSEAIDNKIDCIITHHPYLFSPLASIDLDTVKGKQIQKLLLHHISVYSMHTNFDACKGGVNDVLADKLDIINTLPLEVSMQQEIPTCGIGRYGILKQPIERKTFLEKIKKVFNLATLRVIGNIPPTITKVAVCGGSGASYIKEASNVAEVYLTGDIKFHEAQQALEKGLCVIDIGHYVSENIAIPILASYLSEKLEALTVQIASSNGEVFQIV